MVAFPLEAVWPQSIRPLGPRQRGGEGALGLRPTPAFQPALLPLDPPDAPGEGPFFFHADSIGSQAYAGPLDVILNKGFDLAQLWNREAQIFHYSYGLRHVWASLKDPGQAIQRSGGWWHFLRTQVLPLTLDKRDSKWVPNYFGHAITAGILSRGLGERYEAWGLPLPRVLGGLTTLAAAVLNEAYEHPGMKAGSDGTVADLFVFDPGGVLLLSSDRVARLLSGPLRAAVWPSQASIVAPSGDLVNNGNHLIMKIPWGIIPHTSLFFRTGLSGQWGLTFHRLNGIDLSFGAGFEANRMYIDEKRGAEHVDFLPTGGIFVDRGGSLLASLNVSGIRDRILSLNVYPGVIGGARLGFGGWLVVGEGPRLEVGLTNRRLLGLGLGLGIGP
jgi:hypothetical protein